MTGRNPEIGGMSIVIADPRLLRREWVACSRKIYSEIRSGATMMLLQYAQDRVAVRLAGVQARSTGEREGQRSVTHGFRKLYRPNVQ